MTRLWFALCFVVGSALSSLAQAPASSDRCEKAAQAYEKQRGECADLSQKLSDLKMRMAAEEETTALLRKKCANGDKTACELLSEARSPRLDALQQEYDALAQRGCQNNYVMPQECVQAVKSTNVQAIKSNNKTTGPNRTASASVDSLKAGAKPSVPPSDGQRQASPRIDSSQRVQPHTSGTQPLSSSPSGRSSTGDRSFGSTGLSGSGPGSNAGNSASAPRSAAPAAGTATPK